MRMAITAGLTVLALAVPAGTREKAWAVLQLNGFTGARIAAGWPVEARLAGRSPAPGAAVIEVRNQQGEAVALDWQPAGSGRQWVLHPEATQSLPPGRYEVVLKAGGPPASAVLEVMEPPFEADNEYLIEQIRVFARYERATGQSALAERRERQWKSSRAYASRNSACER